MSRLFLEFRFRFFFSFDYYEILPGLTYDNYKDDFKTSLNKYLYNENKICVSGIYSLLLFLKNDLPFHSSWEKLKTQQLTHKKLESTNQRELKQILEVIFHYSLRICEVSFLIYFLYFCSISRISFRLK